MRARSGITILLVLVVVLVAGAVAHGLTSWVFDPLVAVGEMNGAHVEHEARGNATGVGVSFLLVGTFIAAITWAGE